MYTFNKQTLEYQKVKPYPRLKFAIIYGMFMLLSGYIASSVSHHPNIVEKIVYQQNEMPVQPAKFTEERLLEKLIAYKVKFPELVLAQAKHETGNYTSVIFLENHNLFGMKLSERRPSTAIGINRGHALYKNWEDSVMDYALYQTTYMRTITTEADYIKYLESYYAEDPSYVNFTAHVPKIKEQYDLR